MLEQKIYENRYRKANEVIFPGYVGPKITPIKEHEQRKINEIWFPGYDDTKKMPYEPIIIPTQDNEYPKPPVIYC